MKSVYAFQHPRHYIGQQRKGKVSPNGENNKAFALRKLLIKVVRAWAGRVKYEARQSQGNSHANEDWCCL